MSYQARLEYLALLWVRYQLAKRRKAKTLILDQIVTNLDYNRDAARRVMRKSHPPTERTRNHVCRKEYSQEAHRWIEKLYMEMDRPGGKKLRAQIPLWLEFFEEEGLTAEVRGELLSISSSTIDRILKPFRANLRRKENTGTKRARPAIIADVPIRPLGHKVSKPGTAEVDTVAHCGTTMAGGFVWTLNMIDVYSGWVSCKAIWKKSGHSVAPALEQMETALPFPLTHLFFDGGTEFINNEVVNRYAKRDRALIIGRSRPYHKNDQCYIEQANHTKVRKLVGYGRMEWKVCKNLLNTIYRDWCLLQNHFVVRQRLKTKERHGSRIKRTYYPPTTPYEALLTSPDVSLEDKARLIEEHQGLNPRELARRVRTNVYQLKRYMNTPLLAGRNVA